MRKRRDDRQVEQILAKTIQKGAKYIGRQNEHRRRRTGSRERGRKNLQKLTLENKKKNMKGKSIMIKMLYHIIIIMEKFVLPSCLLATASNN